MQKKIKKQILDTFLKLIVPYTVIRWKFKFASMNMEIY